MNPGKNWKFPNGHQEYTSPGLHFLNSGANLKWQVDGHQESMSTPPWYVMVGDTYGAVVGMVMESDGDGFEPVSGQIVQVTNVPDGGSYTAMTTTDEHGFYYFADLTPSNDPGGYDYQVSLLDMYYVIIPGSETTLLELDGGEIIIVDYHDGAPNIP